MIFHDCEPRSEEWRKFRLGIPTSSNFHKIITPKTRKISSQAPKYMHQLLAEWITGEDIEGYQSEWMVRGQDVEDEIWKAYENYTGTETERGGFITTDDGMVGCSPDRLVGIVGDLEAKAPMIQTQVAYALAGGPDEDYMCQIQGRLFIHGREWVDIFSWHPKLFVPPIRVYRDDKFIAELKPLLTSFVETMLNCRVVLEQRFGPFTRPEPPEAQQHTELDITDADVTAILQDQAARRGNKQIEEE